MAIATPKTVLSTRDLEETEGDNIQNHPLSWKFQTEINSVSIVGNVNKQLNINVLLKSISENPSGKYKSKQSKSLTFGQRVACSLFFCMWGVCAHACTHKCVL